MTLLESQWTQHITRSFYSAYKILKYFQPCVRAENRLLTASQRIPYPRNCSFMKLYLYTHSRLGFSHLRRSLRRCREFFFCTALLSRTLLPKVTLSWPPLTPIFVSSTQWGHMALPGIPLTALRSENCFQAESWAIAGLEITVLHYLLFDVWKQFFHIFCPLCCL